MKRISAGQPKTFDMVFCLAKIVVLSNEGPVVLPSAVRAGMP